MARHCNKRCPGRATITEHSLPMTPRGRATITEHSLPMTPRGRATIKEHSLPDDTKRKIKQTKTDSIRKISKCPENITHETQPVRATKRRTDGEQILTKQMLRMKPSMHKQRRIAASHKSKKNKAASSVFPHNARHDPLTSLIIRDRPFDFLCVCVLWGSIGGVCGRRGWGRGGAGFFLILRFRNAGKK